MKNTKIRTSKLFFLVIFFTFFTTYTTVDTAPRWFIAVKKNTQNATIKQTIDSLNDFKALYPPQGRFYADPMLINYHGKQYIFFEDYVFNKNRALISYVSVDDNLNFSVPKPALELTTHLAFPHVFEDNGHVYMTPETYALKKVFLYEAINFPDQWKQKRVLLTGPNFSDPMIFKHENYYYLFVAVNRYYLRIFYAKSLFETFKPHPINNQENYNLRNAGRIFYKNGTLIRPVMDCSTIYGGAIRLHEIVELSPTTLVEKEVGRIEPTWTPKIVRTHTFNQNNALIVYDGGFGSRLFWRFTRLFT